MTICLFKKFFLVNFQIATRAQTNFQPLKNDSEQSHPKCSILLKLDFRSAFISLNRETMLNSVFSNTPELYN